MGEKWGLQGYTLSAVNLIFGQKHTLLVLVRTVATLTSRPYYTSFKYFISMFFGKPMFVYILLHLHELSFYKVTAIGRSIFTDLFFYTVYLQVGLIFLVRHFILEMHSSSIRSRPLHNFTANIRTDFHP